MNHHEFHISNFPSGHNMFGPDCWCEPSDIYWVRHPQYGQVLIIEHKDDCPFHHATMLAERTSRQDWITQVLNEIPV